MRQFVKDISSQCAELQEMHLVICFIGNGKWPEVKTYMGSGQWGMVWVLEGEKFKHQR